MVVVGVAIYLYIFALSLFLLAYGGGRFKIFNYRRGPLNYIRGSRVLWLVREGDMGPAKYNVGARGEGKAYDDHFAKKTWNWKRVAVENHSSFVTWCCSAKQGRMRSPFSSCQILVIHLSITSIINACACIARQSTSLTFHVPCKIFSRRHVPLEVLLLESGCEQGTDQQDSLRLEIKDRITKA